MIDDERQSILDLQSYNDFTRSYDHKDFRDSLIDPDELSFLDEDWVESYSGRLRNTSTPARLILPFNGLHILEVVSGVDFDEFSDFEIGMAEIHIPPEKTSGIIISSGTENKLEENGMNIEVGDYLRVEGDAFMIPTISRDYAAPYTYLELLAVLPDTGGKLGAGTEDRHDSLVCYVDYESMQRLIGLAPNRKPNQVEFLQDSNTSLENVDIDHPFIPERPRFAYGLLPNQIYIRISDDIDVEHALEVINHELDVGRSGKHRHIAMKSEDFLELGNYQYPLSEKVKSVEDEFFKDTVYYIGSAFVFMLLFLILIDITDRSRMDMQLKLGASVLWQYRYVLMRDMAYTVLPGAVGVLIGLFSSFRYTDATLGFHRGFPLVVLGSYMLFIIMILLMSSLIFLLSRKGRNRL